MIIQVKFVKENWLLSQWQSQQRICICVYSIVSLGHFCEKFFAFYIKRKASEFYKHKQVQYSIWEDECKNCNWKQQTND